MTPPPIAINIVVEDRLSEAVVKAVLNQVERKFMVARRFPDLKRTHASSGFGYIKVKISGFNKASRGIPFLVLTDLDKLMYGAIPSFHFSNIPIVQL